MANGPGVVNGIIGIRDAKISLGGEKVESHFCVLSTAFASKVPRLHG